MGTVIIGIVCLLFVPFVVCLACVFIHCCDRRNKEDGNSDAYRKHAHDINSIRPQRYVYQENMDIQHLTRANVAKMFEQKSSDPPAYNASVTSETVHMPSAPPPKYESSVDLKVWVREWIAWPIHFLQNMWSYLTICRKTLASSEYCSAQGPVTYVLVSLDGPNLRSCGGQTKIWKELIWMNEKNTKYLLALNHINQSMIFFIDFILLFLDEPWRSLT